MDNTQQQLISAFANYFLTGRDFKTIVEARAEAAVILGEPVRPGTPQAKLVDECVEQGLVQAAGVIVHSGAPPQLVYERLVDLYHRQPTLGTRSSTSIAQQAYSTPVPIAYIASQLAGIDQNTVVYEPTAGNGSLLIATELSKAITNELDPQRVANLRVQGYSATQYDATTYLSDQQVDVVIANPPFGSIQEDGKAKVFEIPNLGGQERSFTTTQIDQAIALNALRAMRDDGRAVLILGGKMGDERSRSNGYNSQSSRSFYYTLYNTYNVTRHISIDGDLYSRQGAGFPIDLIVIEGRGKSKLRLPAADVPRIYHSFNELQELLSYAPISEQRQSLDVNFERDDGGHNDGGISTTRPERDIELQRIPGTISNARTMDDPAAGEPERDADANRAIRQFGGDGIPSFSSTEGERTEAVGDRLDRGESIFSGEAELRAINQFSNPSDRESSSNGHDPKDELGGMVAADGTRTEGGLDASVLKTTSQQEIETVVEVTPEETVEQPRQVPYEPLSRGSKGNTLVPINMHSGAANALKQLEQKVGSLDEYVADRLNYGSPERLHHYFNAEQVDAIALAISNLEKRRGFIIGDQTGVGKGRVVAATIRYAKETGRIPIFVTKDPVLYADMMRDLTDINLPAFRPFPTNSSLNIPLSDGRRLQTTSTTHQQEMQFLAASGGIGSYDAVFTTYSQLQSVKGKETQRREFLRAIAPNSIVILDESHEAGGSKHKEKAIEADEERVSDRGL